MSFLFYTLLTLSSYELSEPSIEQGIGEFFQDISAFTNGDKIKVDRIRKYTFVTHRLNDSFSYSIAKVQAEPWIGEFNETAMWVVVREVDGEYYLPAQEDPAKLPTEIQKLIEFLDPQNLKSESPHPFVRAFYEDTDWFRHPSANPSNYSRLRESSAMQVASILKRKTARKTDRCRCTHEVEEGVFVHKNSSLWKDRGVWIYDLHGTPEEQAFAIGALSRDLVQDSALPHYAGRIDRAIHQSALVRTVPFLEPLVQVYVNYFHYDALADSFNEQEKKMIFDFSDAAEVDEFATTRSILLPDVAQYLMAKSYSGLGKIVGAFGALPSLGCSTFVQQSRPGEAEYMLARNLDYEGGGVFDKNAAIYYFNSSSPEDQSFVSVSTVANPLGALTAKNESGIILSLHQLMSEDVSRHGRPILAVTTEIMRKARSLEDGIAILKKYKHPSTWRVILSSISENRTISAEISALEVEIVDFKNFGQGATNSAVTRAMQASEYSTGYNYYSDSRFRFQNLQYALQSRPALQLQDAVDLISSDRFLNPQQARGAERFSNGIIAKRSNVQSVVFAPERDVVYVAVPKMKDARPLEGSYVPFSLSKARPSGAITASAIERSRPYDPQRVEANAYYRRASILLSEQGNFKAGLKLLDRAMAVDPGDYIYPMMSGYAHFLAAWNARENDKAETEEVNNLLARGVGFLRLAASMNPSDYHLQVIKLFEARYFWMTGEDEKAREQIEKLDTHYSLKLKDAAKRSKSGYSLSQARKIIVDYMNMDLLAF